MTLRLTNDEFINSLNTIYGIGVYIPLDSYINSSTKIKILHTECNKVSFKTPNSLLQFVGCKYCRGGVTYTHEYFIKLLQNKFGNLYTPLDTYINSKTPIKIICNVCGNKFQKIPAKLLQGQGCKCQRSKLPQQEIKSNETFIDEVEQLYGKEYRVISEYKGAYKNITIFHNFNKCMQIFNTTPHNFLRGRRCPHCYKTVRKTTSEFIKEIEDMYNNEYTVLGEYINNSTPILVKHNICHKEYMVRPSNLLSSKQCPCKKRSLGEEKIAQILNKHNIKFEPQATIDGCKKVRLLRFDFKVYTETSFFLIEYDGSPHIDKNAFGNEDAHNNLVENDNIKNEFCKKNKYDLYRLKSLNNLDDYIMKILRNYFSL